MARAGSCRVGGRHEEQMIKRLLQKQIGELLGRNGLLNGLHEFDQGMEIKKEVKTRNRSGYAN